MPLHLGFWPVLLQMNEFFYSCIWHGEYWTPLLSVVLPCLGLNRFKHQVHCTWPDLATYYALVPLQLGRSFAKIQLRPTRFTNRQVAPKPADTLRWCWPPLRQAKAAGVTEARGNISSPRQQTSSFTHREYKRNVHQPTGTVNHIQTSAHIIHCSS